MDTVTRDAIRMWRDGQSVHVVSMGGMGTNYEQGIWEIAFAAIEEMIDNPPRLPQVSRVSVSTYYI